MTVTTADRAWMGGRRLREAYGDFLWRRPSMFVRELVLEAGSERLASLHWDKWYSFDALAVSADGRWRLSKKRGGSLISGCAVHDANGAEVASFERNWRSTGRVRFTSGAEYAWQREGFWRAHYFWTRADGTPLVTFQRKGLLGSYEMIVDPSAREVAEFPVLVVLGSYIMAMLSARRRAH